MLTKCSSHAEFKQFLRQQVPLLWALEKDRLLTFSMSLSKVWFLNLDPAVSLLSVRFSSTGRPVFYDPVCILRSLVLMLDLGYHCVTKRVLSGRAPFPLRAEKFIQMVFARCFVDVSVHMDLIPDPLELVLSGDGSSLRTGSGPYGVKVCDCRKKGIFSCDCKRRFSDPEASWGWEVCVMNITMDILLLF